MCLKCVQWKHAKQMVPLPSMFLTCSYLFPGAFAPSMRYENSIPLTYPDQSDPSRTKSHRQAGSTTAFVAPQHQTPLLNPHAIPPTWGPPFTNPGIPGEPPQDNFQPEESGPKLDPRYTGVCDSKPEDPECSDPDELNQMDFNRRAIWLGRWFALHYTAWVSDIREKIGWLQGIRRSM